MSSAVPNSPKAKPLTGGNPEAISAHSEVEEDASEDEDEVIETALNGRWQKLNVKVSVATLNSTGTSEPSRNRNSIHATLKYLGVNKVLADQFFSYSSDAMKDCITELHYN